MASEQKQVAPTGVRLPDDLRDWLKQRAETNSRSLNQEIVHRLKLSREQEVTDAKS